MAIRASPLCPDADIQWVSTGAGCYVCLLTGFAPWHFDSTTHDHLDLREPPGQGFRNQPGSIMDIELPLAAQLRRRCDLQARDIPFHLQDFIDRHEGRYHDVQLPLPMPGLHVVS